MELHNINRYNESSKSDLELSSKDTIPTSNDVVFDINDFSSIDFLVSRDPTEDFELLYKYVNIHTRSGYNYIGYIFTIDPVSRTVVLVNNNDVSIVPGINIEYLTKIKDVAESDYKSLMSMLDIQSPVAQDSLINCKKTLHRRDQLLTWLKAGKVPTKLDDKDPLTIIVGYEALEIKPPYLTENFHSSSVTILSKMIKICNAMPTADQ